MDVVDDLQRLEVRVCDVVNALRLQTLLGTDQLSNGTLTILLALAGVSQQSLLLAIADQLDAGRIRHVLHGQIGHVLQNASIRPAGNWHFAKEGGRFGSTAAQSVPAVISNGIDYGAERSIHQW